MPANGGSVSRYLTGAFFIGAGALHASLPAPFVRIMPPYIPAPLAMVYLSGAAEISGGLGLCIRTTRLAASWGLVALLIAVFPANVYMATNNVQVTEHPVPVLLLWARLPLQALLIWWVLRMGKRNEG